MPSGKEEGMKIFKRVLAALVALAAVVTAFVRFPLPDRIAASHKETPPPAAISRFYRESEGILLATCIRTAPAEDGGSVARMRIDSVLDGQAEEGEVVSIRAEAASGAQYLLYLAPRAEEGQAEETLLTGQPLPVESGSVMYEGELLPISAIVRDIERQREILTVPSQTVFYDSIESLAAACDEIVIARVVGKSEPRATLCRSAEKGASTLSTIEQVFLTVKVENGLFGDLTYGDKLSVVIEPYNVRPVINAVDLKPKTVEAPPESSPELGSVYIFFLLRSEDKKSSYYFTVNPYEGWVLLIGGSVIRPYYNTAFSRTSDLTRFVERLQAAREAE